MPFYAGPTETAGLPYIGPFGRHSKMVHKIPMKFTIVLSRSRLRIPEKFHKNRTYRSSAITGGRSHDCWPAFACTGLRASSTRVVDGRFETARPNPLQFGRPQETCRPHTPAHQISSLSVLPIDFDR